MILAEPAGDVRRLLPARRRLLPLIQGQRTELYTGPPGMDVIAQLVLGVT